MAQTRKQKVLQNVQRQRRQRAIVSLAIATVLIVVIVAAVFALSKPTAPNRVLLPPYLDECIPQDHIIVHTHPQLFINVSGAPIVIPANLGIPSSLCFRPLHTHDTTGTIHVETNENRVYTLGDFFLIWGNTANDPTYAMFNSTQIFDHKVTPGHQLTMTVNNTPDNSFQNYALPTSSAYNNIGSLKISINYN